MVPHSNNEGFEERGSKNAVRFLLAHMNTPVKRKLQICYNPGIFLELFINSSFLMLISNRSRQRSTCFFISLVIDVNVFLYMREFPWSQKKVSLPFIRFDVFLQARLLPELF